MALDSDRLGDAWGDTIKALMPGLGGADETAMRNTMKALAADEHTEIKDNAEVATSVNVTSVSGVVSGGATSGPGTGSGTGTVS